MGTQMIGEFWSVSTRTASSDSRQRARAGALEDDILLIESAEWTFHLIATCGSRVAGRRSLRTRRDRRRATGRLRPSTDMPRGRGHCGIRRLEVSPPQGRGAGRGRGAVVSASGCMTPRRKRIVRLGRCFGHWSARRAKAAAIPRASLTGSGLRSERPMSACSSMPGSSWSE